MSRKLFHYRDSDLFFADEKQSLAMLVKDYKQPVWIYKKSVIQERISWIKKWPHLGRLHYAMKANFHPEILKIMKSSGCGIDAVSLGEMKHAVSNGFAPEDIILSGVAKTNQELTWAIENEIYQINIESPSELTKIIEINKTLKKKVSLAIRVNPEIDGGTHPKIATALKDSKFGVDFKTAEHLIEIISHNYDLNLKAISFFPSPSFGKGLKCCPGLLIPNITLRRMLKNFALSITSADTWMRVLFPTFSSIKKAAKWMCFMKSLKAIYIL